MKVKVLKPFIDLSDGANRKVGDVFECSEKRFNEIVAKLPDWVESVSEPAPASEPTSAPAKKTSKTSSKKSGK